MNLVMCMARGGIKKILLRWSNQGELFILTRNLLTRLRLLRWSNRERLFILPSNLLTSRGSERWSNQGELFILTRNLLTRFRLLIYWPGVPVAKSVLSQSGSWTERSGRERGSIIISINVHILGSGGDKIILNFTCLMKSWAGSEKRRSHIYVYQYSCWCSFKEILRKLLRL